MAKRTTRPGQGFSLFELREDISQAVELLGNALSRQGVNVDQDNLYLQLQSVIKSVGDGYTYSNSLPGSYPAMNASEEAPYSVAGDLIAIAFGKFSNGDKKGAVKEILTAMSSDDFGEIVAGLVAMNSKSSIQKMIADDDSEDSDEDEETDDSDSSEEDQDDGDAETDETDDLNDEDIDALVNDDSEDESDEEDSDKDKNLESDDTETDKTDDSDEESEEEETEEDKSLPMGGTSSTVTASHNARVLANKLSLDGTKASASKAKMFLRKHPKVGK